MLLWILFNSIKIHWGHLIRYRMTKALRDNAHLPYPYLITIFMEHFGVLTDSDHFTQVKFKHRKGYEVVASFRYVQNVEGVWVPKIDAPNQQHQGREE